MSITDTLHEINRPVYAYHSVKQKIWSIIFLIISVIILFIGILFIIFGGFKLGLIILAIVLVFFVLSRLVKLGSKIDRQRAGF